MAEEMNLIMQPYSVVVIREWERATSRKRVPLRGKQWMTLLTSCDLSSLVIDKLCDEAMEREAARYCRYLLLLRLFYAEGAVADQYARFSSETAG